eukprot:5981880-Lingulodinium_polyedra.AAC.1
MAMPRNTHFISRRGRTLPLRALGCPTVGGDGTGVVDRATGRPGENFATRRRGKDNKTHPTRAGGNHGGQNVHA